MTVAPFRHAHLNPRPLVGAAVAVVLAAALACLVSAWSPGVRTGLLLGISSVLLVPVVYRLALRRFDVFEPIWLFVLAWGAMFVVRPIAVIQSGDLVYERPTRVIDISETLNLTLVLALIGAASFVVAYFLPVGRYFAAKLPAPARAFHHDSLLTGTTLLVCAALAAFSLFFYTEVGVAGMAKVLGGRSLERAKALDRSSTYLALAPLLLIPCTTLLFAVARDRRSIAAGVLAAGVGVLALALTVPVGSRTALLPFISSLLVYFYLSRNSRPHVLTCLLLLLAGAILSSTVLETRTLAARKSLWNTAAELVVHPSDAFEPITSGPDVEMAPALASALTVIPEKMPHTYGSSLAGDLLTRPIPRQLWGGKPLAPREQVIRELWPTEYASHIANPEFSVMLVLFLDGGVVGVVAGMVAFGIGARLLYEYLLRYPDRLEARLIFSLGLPFMIGGVRDSLVDTFIRAMFIVFPIILVFRFSKSREAEAA